MRFIITGEWSRNTLLRLILVMFMVYVALFVVSSALMYFTKMSLDPESVVSYFLGDPDQEFGRPARPYKALLETSHLHLFAMGMLVMVLTHLLLFAPVAPRLKGLLVTASFATALLNEASNWLVRFVHAGFAWLKVASFLAMEASLIALTIVILATTLRSSRNAYKDTNASA